MITAAIIIGAVAVYIIGGWWITWRVITGGWRNAWRRKW